MSQKMQTLYDKSKSLYIRSISPINSLPIRSSCADSELLISQERKRSKFN